MKQYVFKERGGIAVTALMLAFFVFGGVALSSVGIEAVIFVVLCGGFVLGVTVYTCFQTRIISEAGITVKTILKTTFVPWRDVERIGVAHLPAGPAWHWELSVTYRTVSGKKRELVLPYTDPLRAAVVEFYGEPDFDEKHPASLSSGDRERPARIADPWIKDRRVFAVLGCLMAAFGVLIGVLMGAWLPVIATSLLALSFVTVFVMDYPSVAMNGKGIAYRFLLRRRYVSWCEIRQAGVCLFEVTRPGGNVNKSYKLGLLLPGGVPKMPGQRISYYKNMGRIIYLPATPEIRKFVIAHYGLLDFDESADPRGYSIVVD